MSSITSVVASIVPSAVQANNAANPVQTASFSNGTVLNGAYESVAVGNYLYVISVTSKAR